MRNTFSPNVVVLLASAAVMLFALTFILSAKSEPTVKGNTYGPGTHSVSALGYAAYYEMLRKSGLTVVKSSGSAFSLAGANGTIIMAEPDISKVVEDEASEKVRRMLVVLPKWQAHQDRSNPSWIDGATLVKPQKAEETASVFTGKEYTILRTDWPTNWTLNKIGHTPKGSGTLQLIKSDSLRPLVSTKDGILLGEFIEDSKKIWILTDPDLMSNFGIVKGSNALFMYELMETLRMWENNDSTAPIVFDETLHGFRKNTANSLLKMLFQFPYYIIILLICGSALILVLAGASRFGSPVAETPALDFGKSSLISNSAKLLDYAGFHASVLHKYIQMTVRSTARSLHAPTTDSRALLSWLETIGKNRRVRLSPTAIMAKASTISVNTNNKAELAALFECAYNIYRWKGEILNGSSANRTYR